MADIDVERKSSMTWLWWLLGLILLGLILWIALWGTGRDAADTIVPAPVAGPEAREGDLAALPEELRTFESECTADGAAPATDMGVEHEYTVTCLRGLREALGAITVRDTVGGVDVQGQLDDFEQAVDTLEASAADAATHSGLTREAAMAGTRVMEGMRDAYFRTSQEVGPTIDRARSTAEGIDADTPLLEQRDAVRRFFREAASSLRAMWQGFGAVQT